MTPLAALNEGACAGFVYEAVIKKTYRRKNCSERVTVHSEPSLMRFLHVNAETERAVINAHQLVIAEETLADSVYKFFVVNGEKLPLTDALY